MTHQAVTDARGLPLTGATAEAAEQLEAVLDDSYYYRPGVPERLDALLEAFPDFGLARVYKGYSIMSEGFISGADRAQDFLAQAETLPASRRERLHQEALRAWIAGDSEARAAAWEQILVEWPRDLLALRQFTGTLFWSGDKRRQAEITASVASQWDSATPGYAHFLSAHAFAMEEFGQYSVAEHAARDALAIQPQDLWAMHALAHVLEMQGRATEGLEILEDASSFFNDYNLFRGHLWWHLALFMLSERRFDDVLALYDREIFPTASLFYLDIQNASSMLARLEFQGVDVGDARWERIAQASLRSATQHTIWFTTMHHVMALVRSGRLSAVQSTLEYLLAEAELTDEAALAHDLSRAAADFYQDRHHEALEGLLAVRHARGALGASHAQQDLYDQMTVMAALAINDFPRVRQLLKARLGTRVWDAASWKGFAYHSRRIDTLCDADSVRDELLWRGE